MPAAPRGRAREGPGEGGNSAQGSTPVLSAAQQWCGGAAAGPSLLLLTLPRALRSPHGRSQLRGHGAGQDAPLGTGIPGAAGARATARQAASAGNSLRHRLKPIKKPPKNQAVTPPCTFSSLYLQLWQHRPDQLVSTGKVPAPSWGPKSVPGAAPTAPLRARVGRGRSLSPEGPGTVQGTVQGMALRGCWRNGEALRGRSGALPKAKAAGTGTSSITAGQRQLWHGAGKARIPEQRQRLRGSKGHEDAGRPPGPPPPGSLHSSPESRSCGLGGGGHPAALSLPP